MGNLTASGTRLRALGIVIGVATAAAAAPAHGEQVSNTVKATLKVDYGCKLNTSPLYFGRVTSKDNTATASTTIAFECNPGTVFTVGIDNGLHWDGKSRRMYGGTNGQGAVWYVNYRLYRDSTRLLPWGNTAGTNLAGVVPPSGRQTLTIYGTADPKNARSSGYDDYVTIVLDF